MDLRGGRLVAINGKATILATGGCGRVYEFTTNGFIKTGDGMALAYRAGVPLKDMEMVQFHPTCLPGTGILITEAARGEGGYLINKDGERYMQRYLPGKMELGPRDILSRAMVQEMKEGRAFEGPYGLYLGLDLRHLGAKKINERIPMVRELAEKYMGLDPVHEPIPVRAGQGDRRGDPHRDAAAHGARCGDLPRGIRPLGCVRHAGEAAGPLRVRRTRGQGSRVQHGAHGRPRARLHARHHDDDRAQRAESSRVPRRAQPHRFSAAGRCELPEAHARVPDGRSAPDRLRPGDDHEVATRGEEVLGWSNPRSSFG